VVAGRLALNPWWGLQQNRHLVLLPTVMLAAWFGGFRPGVASATLSTLALHLWWSKSPGPLHPPSVDVVLFFAFSLVICAVVSSLQAARARADAAARSLERVLEIVAHDLRSPLTGIKALAESIGRGTPTLVPRLQKIDRAVGRMDRLIGQLVESTRIGHGELEVTTRPESVRSIVRETLDLFSPIARDREITLEEGQIPIDAVVAADRDRIMQVLANLVANALKFTAPGGRVTLTARQRNDAVELTVADTGRGIGDGDLPHIFEQYWRGDERGTGLGLFIARSVVQAHGGRIWAESKPGIGTTFFFTLPAVPASSGDAARRPGLDDADAIPAGAFPPSPPGG
jgi:signal transduction histidine kinase